MSTPMTRWGVGPRFTKLSALWGLGVVVARVVTPETFTFGDVPYAIMAGVGGTLVALGILMYVAALASVHPAFDKGELRTRGVYGLCRHPVYASWAVLITPGVGLLIDSWLAFVAALVMYVSLRVLVPREEKLLEEKFGGAYREYKRRVPAAAPVGWVTSRLRA